MSTPSTPCTPPELRNEAMNAREDLLPKKSKPRYIQAYDSFVLWQRSKNAANVFTENVLLAYFGELSNVKCPSTLWSIYSMLKNVINLKHRVDISKYHNLQALLKVKNKGYKPNQAKVFREEEIARFIMEAPDEIYLATKIICVFGTLGACRSDEMTRLKTSDVVRFDEPEKMFLVSIPEENKTSVDRSFTISSGVYFDLVEKYMQLRPPDMPGTRFFTSYQNGKCVHQFIGKNKISSAAKEIAKYLDLPPGRYSGHSFRRSSTTILADAGADPICVTRQGGWKSMSTAQRYIDNSLFQKRKAEKLITNQIGLASSSDNQTAVVSSSANQIGVDSFCGNQIGVASSSGNQIEVDKSSRNRIEVASSFELSSAHIGDSVRATSSCAHINDPIRTSPSTHISDSVRTNSYKRFRYKTPIFSQPLVLEHNTANQMKPESEPEKELESECVTLSQISESEGVTLSQISQHIIEDYVYERKTDDKRNNFSFHNCNVTINLQK